MSYSVDKAIQHEDLPVGDYSAHQPYPDSADQAPGDNYPSRAVTIEQPPDKRQGQRGNDHERGHRQG